MATNILETYVTRFTLDELSSLKKDAEFTLRLWGEDRWNPESANTHPGSPLYETMAKKRDGIDFSIFYKAFHENHGIKL